LLGQIATALPKTIISKPASLAVYVYTTSAQVWGVWQLGGYPIASITDRLPGYVYLSLGVNC